MININILIRLIRAKYRAPNNMITEGNREEIEELFAYHFAHAKAAVERKGYKHWMSVLQMREGIFYHKPTLVEKGLSWLKTNMRQNMYPLALTEFLSYCDLLAEDIPRALLDISVGHRVSKAADAQKYDRATMAALLGIQEKSLNQIYQGRRGFDLPKLLKISKFLQLPIDSFVHGDDMLPQGDAVDIFLKDLGTALRSAPPEKQEQMMEMINMTKKISFT